MKGVFDLPITPKCQICKKELDRNTAFKVTQGRRNLYYCSKEEYDKLFEQDRMMDKVYSEIAYHMGYSALTKNFTQKINTLNEPAEVILATIKAQQNGIQWAMENKNFSSDWHRFAYILAIIKNHIPETKKQLRQEKKADNSGLQEDMFELPERKRKPDNRISKFIGEDEL